MPRTIHSLTRMMCQLVPPLSRWDRFVSSIGRRFPAREEDVIIQLDHDNRMKLNLADFVGYHIFVRGYYEPDVVRAMKAMLEPGMIVFDIGAHFGQYTLIASAKVGEAGSVHAFEPGPEQMEYLRSNVELNARSNVKLIPLALADHSGEIRFAIGPRANLGASHIATSDEDTIAVQAITLDQYCEDNDVRRIDVMKMDVEGAEKYVLAGGRRTFTESPPRAVFYECIASLSDRFGYSHLEIHDFFRSVGYKIMTSTNTGLQSVQIPPPPDVSDFVAIRF